MKKHSILEGYDLDHLMVVREIWKMVSCGEIVCVVTDTPCGWESVFGTYIKMMKTFINQGLVYMRTTSDLGGDPLKEEDFNNMIVEVNI